MGIAQSTCDCPSNGVFVESVFRSLQTVEKISGVEGMRAYKISSSMLSIPCDGFGSCYSERFEAEGSSDVNWHHRCSGSVGGKVRVVIYCTLRIYLVCVAVAVEI